MVKILFDITSSKKQATLINQMECCLTARVELKLKCGLYVHPGIIKLPITTKIRSSRCLARLGGLIGKKVQCWATSRCDSNNNHQCNTQIWRPFILSGSCSYGYFFCRLIVHYKSVTWFCFSVKGSIHLLHEHGLLWLTTEEEGAAATFVQQLL